MNKYLELRKNLRIRTIYFKEMTITLFNEKELSKAQIGYSLDDNGQSLCGTNSGDWQLSWFVIGEETLCGDPVFVDLANDDLPVYTAAHDFGDWQPMLLAKSFESFLLACGHKTQ